MLHVKLGRLLAGHGIFKRSNEDALQFTSRSSGTPACSHALVGKKKPAQPAKVRETEEDTGKDPSRREGHACARRVPLLPEHKSTSGRPGPTPWHRYTAAPCDRAPSMQTVAEKVGGSCTSCRQYEVTGSEKKSGIVRRVRDGDGDGVGDDDGDTIDGVEAEGRVTPRMGLVTVIVTARCRGRWWRHRGRRCRWRGVKGGGIGVEGGDGVEGGKIG
jgi:hypothetical protein